MVTDYLKMRDFEKVRYLNITILYEERSGYFALVGQRNQKILLDKMSSKVDLDSVNRYLNESAETLVRTMKSRRTSIASLPDLLCAPGIGLAARGYFTLKNIFGSSSDVFRANDRSGALPFFEIKTDSFFIPWEWLYSEMPENFSSESGLYSLAAKFWGLSHVVARESLNRNEFASHNGHNSATRAPALRVPPHVGLVLDRSLSFANFELDKLIELSERESIKLTQFEPAAGSSDYALIRDLNEFLSRDFDILHFACHAKGDNSGLSSHFTVSREDKTAFEYQLAFLEGEPGVQIKSPLIFFNACSTASRNPEQTYNFVEMFLIQQASTDCMVAIESSVESQVAEDFSSAFYDNLLAGSPVGLAVYLTRNALFRNMRRPEDIVSLFYSIHGNADLAIDPRV